MLAYESYIKADALDDSVYVILSKKWNNLAQRTLY